jgi:hypothetical protein
VLSLETKSWSGSSRTSDLGVGGSNPSGRAIHLRLMDSLSAPRILTVLGRYEGDVLMVYDIRPLSFGEILDRAFRVYLDNFALLFGISAVVWIPSGIVLASGSVIGKTAANAIYMIFLLVVAPLMQAALTIGVAEAYLGRPTTLVETYQSARPLFLPLIGTYLLFALLFAIPGGVVGASFLVSRALFVLAGVAFVIVIFYFLGCWALVGPVMIVERHFGMSALRRSRELVLGSWWRTMGILFTASLIANVPLGALGLVWRFIPVVGVILNAATQAVTSTYGLVAMVIYYFDRRCRTEDFDLRLLAEQVRSQSAPTMAPAPGSSSLA